MPQRGRIAIIKNWLDRKDLQIFEMLTQTEQERCNIMVGLFTTLNTKFKPQYNETIKSLQFHKSGSQMKIQKNGWVNFDLLL